MVCSCLVANVPTLTVAVLSRRKVEKLGRLCLFFFGWSAWRSSVMSFTLTFLYFSSGPRKESGYEWLISVNHIFLLRSCFLEFLGYSFCHLEPFCDYVIWSLFSVVYLFIEVSIVFVRESNEVVVYCSRATD
jgi:hypothetical protein